MSRIPWGFDTIFGPGGIAHPDTTQARIDRNRTPTLVNLEFDGGIVYHLYV